MISYSASSAPSSSSSLKASGLEANWINVESRLTVSGVVWRLGIPRNLLLFGFVFDGRKPIENEELLLAAAAAAAAAVLKDATFGIVTT
jgi:hypothetical protein